MWVFNIFLHEHNLGMDLLDKHLRIWWSDCSVVGQRASLVTNSSTSVIIYFSSHFFPYSRVYMARIKPNLLL